ncbi:MAG TPA: DUF4392 domain-containing protein [Pirellulales bacterium]|nr:DUF4392 domain-containing protein [Pirellulales bacterium]
MSDRLILWQLFNNSFMPTDFEALEAVIRQDPGGRGVASYWHNGQWLAPGVLERAARDLAQSQGAVAIVTGFCVAEADPPAAETDGPPGALFLARAWEAMGRKVVLISDAGALGLLRIGCRLWRLEAELVELPPATRHEVSAIAIERLLPPSLCEQFSHLIAIERVGPSHTLDSLSAQAGNATEAVARFILEVPVEHRNACHNMRGTIIDQHTSPAHRLFEPPTIAERRVTTLGIGDGGNEIGMGAIPWEVLRTALKGEHAGRIICRVATDFLILAGVSNWGAYALACAMAGLLGRNDLIAQWDEAGQRELIEVLVREGGAVDGVTRRREPTVDGLPLDDYLSVLAAIRATCS